MTTIIPPSLIADQNLYVRDEKASGTLGGTFTSGSWQTRTLNTSVINTISGASLASNQITLPAGTYMIRARAPAFAVDTHKTKLYNITDAADTIIGSTSYVSSSLAVQTDSTVNGIFTIYGTKVFELQHRAESTNSGDGFGYTASGFSVSEVYAEVFITKLA